MKYLLFCDQEETVRIHANRWIQEHGGSIPISVLEEKFRERFHFFFAEEYTSTEWERLRLGNVFVPYVIDEAGNVSSIH